MNLTSTQVIEKWLNYLPAYPKELNWLLGKDILGGEQQADERLLRWLREQLRQARIRAEHSLSGPIELHLHFGFGDAELRKRLFSILSILLAIEAAHESIAMWPSMADWLLQDANSEETLASRIQLFNPLSWRSGVHKPFFILQDIEEQLPSNEPGQTLLRFQTSASTISLPTELPAIYELSTGQKLIASAVASRMRAYYSPPTDYSSITLTEGCIAGTPHPVAIWSTKELASTLPRWLSEPVQDTEVIRTAVSPGTSPLLWTLGPPKDSTVIARTAILKRSSVLFFFGRVPAIGSYNKNTCPKIKLVVSTTMRSRALAWGELPKQVVSVQAVPLQADWFGQPFAREIAYEVKHFYQTSSSENEARLQELVSAYNKAQDAENAARAAEDNTDYLSPLPWNLLHWVRDATTAAAVLGYITRQFNQVYFTGERRRDLEVLAKHITDLLAEMQPLWHQLRKLPKEHAYVVVPIHVCQPRYLNGFLGLTQDLRNKKLAEFSHLTFIAPTELSVIANTPARPVYVTAVQPRYWWAIRQLPATTQLSWLLHEGLFHDAFCHAVLRQFEQERDAIHRQLWPLTAYANPDEPAAAALELTADLNALTPQLPFYRAPTLYNRIGANIALETTSDFNNASSPKTSVAKPRHKRPSKLTVEPTEFSNEEMAAANEVGLVAPEAPSVELDEAVLYIDPSQRTPENVDEAVRLQETEEVEELLSVLAGEDTDSLPIALGNNAESLNPHQKVRKVRVRGINAFEERPVWVLRHADGDWLLEKCLLTDVHGGEKYLDEKHLRESLNRAANTAISASRSTELPFWKQALREFATQNYRNRPERLYKHMMEGKFGGIRLNLAESTFLRVYLAWDAYCQPIESITRVPGSWQNRNAIYQVIGSQGGQIDEMQLLSREDRLRRTLSDQEGALLRLEYQKVRRELLTWWQQDATRSSGLISQFDIKQSLARHVSAHFEKFKVFKDTNDRKLTDVTEDVCGYFHSILTAALQEK